MRQSNPTTHPTVSLICRGLGLWIGSVALAFALISPPGFAQSPEATSIPVEQISKNAKKALAATMAVLFDKAQSNPVAAIFFAPGVRERWAGKFSYPGFSISDMVITVDQQANEVGQVAGLLRLVAQPGRRAMVSFITDYSGGADAIVVSSVSLLEVAPDIPAALVFLTPPNTVQTEQYLLANDYSGLLQAVISQAVSLNAKSGSQDLLVGPGIYDVFTFIMDRSLPGSVFDLHLQETTQVGLPAAHMNFDGWQVLRARTNFAFASDANMTVKILYIAGASVQPNQATAREIAAFIFHPVAQPAPAASASPATNALLSLGKSVDARKVQQRLKDLGFLSGAVDGAWGPQARQALRTFKNANGLENSAIWDKETQSLLMP